MSDDDDLVPWPRETAGLIGHEETEAMLAETFASGRFHHAWLISGPKGIGKATLAYRFARHVLAADVPMPEKKTDTGASLFGDLPADTPDEDERIPGPGEAGPLYVAPEHPVFQRVASGGHADLLTVERSFNKDTGRLRGEIVVDDVRGIGGFMRLTAAEGGWRIVIIDAADEMNVNAANAVLKVLEEPPKNAMLLLVCHNPGRLLPTIRSRCRKLPLNTLSTDQVMMLLAHLAPDIPRHDAALLAKLADGSIGRALALAEEGGIDLYREVTTLLDSLPNLNHLALHALGDRMGRAQGGQAFETVTDILRWWFARFLRYGATGGQGVGFEAEETAVMDRLLAARGLDRWLGLWEKITDLFGRTGAVNLDEKQVVLNAFLMMEDTARS